MAQPVITPVRAVSMAIRTCITMLQKVLRDSFMLYSF